MSYLYQKLTEYSKSENYPFHMPGHKRRMGKFVNPFQIDITEIEGFDNLHHAEGLIKAAQERAAQLYGSEETYFLCNGSTAGILSAISACTTNGGTMLMARNCHKTAYHGAMLKNLQIEYLYPEQENTYGLNGGLSPTDVEEMLIKHPDIQAVMITSPTYDGVVSDICAIAKMTHQHGKVLIVDEAHGAHFGFHPYFPENAVKLGADVVIHSLHKTLPAFTQTALLHLNGDLVDRERIRKYLEVYQSSSPSYVLMAGIDNCIRILEEQGTHLFSCFVERLQKFRQGTKNLNTIRVVDGELIGSNGIYDMDLSKLLLSTKGGLEDGNALYRILLKDYRLQLEMAAGDYALALCSIGDTEEGFERLEKALREIDQRNVVNQGVKKEADTPIINEVAMTMGEAQELAQETVFLGESVGRISAEYAYLYPPGIPLIVPGEKISGEFVEKILQYRGKGLLVQGLSDFEAKEIRVLV